MILLKQTTNHSFSLALAQKISFVFQVLLQNNKNKNQQKLFSRREKEVKIV